MYILGVGTVYYVANVVVVGSASLDDQGSVTGVFNVDQITHRLPSQH